jgi:hypothetical protein
VERLTIDVCQNLTFPFRTLVSDFAGHRSEHGGSGADEEAREETAGLDAGVGIDQSAYREHLGGRGVLMIINSDLALVLGNDRRLEAKSWKVGPRSAAMGW